MTTFVETSNLTIKANFIQSYPLLSFLMLAFGLTRIFIIADALGSHEALPFRLPIPLLILGLHANPRRGHCHVADKR
jgi:hypothetical protein